MSKARAVLQVPLPINRPRKLFLFSSVTIFPSISLLGSDHLIFMGGGGQEDFAKKISGCDLREKKFSGPKGREKKFSGLPWEALSHSDTCFRTPKSAFRTPKSAFAVQNLHFALRKLLYALQKLHYILWEWLFAL